MSQSILRPIKEGEDITDIVRVVILTLALVATVGICLIAGWTMYESSKPENIEAAYRERLMQLEADPDWQAEQKRLHRKHGKGRLIIYTPDETYFIDDSGRKCRFL